MLPLKDVPNMDETSTNFVRIREVEEKVKRASIFLPTNKFRKLNPVSEGV